MEFKVSESANIRNTALRGYFLTNYEKLAKAFGPPNLGSRAEGSKVSTGWKFVSDEGVVCTLYDYKETSLYSPNLPSVEEFRSKQSYDWHVGALTDEHARKFFWWLETKVSGCGRIG